MRKSNYQRPYHPADDELPERPSLDGYCVEECYAYLPLMADTKSVSLRKPSAAANTASTLY